MKEPSLLELERWMKSQIRPGVSKATEERVLFNPQRGEPGEARLSVYAEGYEVRIRESLAEVYVSVRHIVGEASFRELARSYAGRYPSHDYNLSHAGRHFSEFLKNDPLTNDLPFLPDLARLEWKAAKAFHAVDEDPLDAAALASVSQEEWNRATFFFQPSVALLRSDWPIGDIWEARKTPRERIDIDLVNRPQHLLLFREEREVRCERVDENEFIFLEKLFSGRTLGESLEGLVLSEASFSIPSAMSRLTRDGLCSRIIFR